MYVAIVFDEMKIKEGIDIYMQMKRIISYICVHTIILYIYENNSLSIIKNKIKNRKKGVSVQLFPAPMLRFLSALTQIVSE